MSLHIEGQRCYYDLVKIATNADLARCGPLRCQDEGLKEALPVNWLSELMSECLNSPNVVMGNAEHAKHGQDHQLQASF